MSYQGCSSMIQYKLVTHHEPEYIKKNEVFYKEFAEKVFNRKPHFLSSDISVRQFSNNTRKTGGCPVVNIGGIISF